MICDNCGRQLHDRAVFCDNCGHSHRPNQLREMPQAQPERALESTSGEEGILLSLASSAMALAALVCLHLKWLVVFEHSGARHDSYTLLQIAKSISVSAAGEMGALLANLLTAVVLLDTALWAIFIWRMLRHSFFTRMLSQLAGIMTVALVMVTSLAVTMLNSEGIMLVGPAADYVSARMSVAAFLAAVFSVLMVAFVSIRRFGDRRVGGGIDAREVVFGEKKEEPDSLISSLMDLDVLLDSGCLGSALAGTTAGMSWMTEDFDVGRCPDCGAAIGDKAEYCRVCGSVFELQGV
jgi:ribosomal protein L40E